MWLWKNEKYIFQVCQLCAGCEFHLKVLVPRHSFVGEFGQEHGDECRKAPLCSQLVWADPCQPQDVLRDVWGLALEHSTLVQTQSRRGKATEGRWDGQTHAGEETTPPRWVLILGPLKGRQETAARSKMLMNHKVIFSEKTWVKSPTPRCGAWLYCSYHTDTVWASMARHEGVLFENQVSTLIDVVVLRWKQPFPVIEKTSKPVLFKRAFSWSCKGTALVLLHIECKHCLRYDLKSVALFRNCTDCVHKKFILRRPALRNWSLFLFTPNYSIFNYMHVYIYIKETQYTQW